MRRNFLFSSSTTKTGFCNQSSAAKIIASQFSSIFAFSSSLLSRDTYNNINNKKFNFHQSLLSSSSSSPHLFTQKRFQYGGAPPTDDYYSILGISPSASTSEIKSAYKKLAMQYHPDRNTAAGAEDKFKKVSEAYSVLSNSDKKKQYDAMRSFGRSSSGGMGGMGGMPGMGGGGAGPYANYSQRGPGSSAGAYGGNSSSYSAQYSSRGGPQNQQQQGRAGQSSFVFHNISKEEADQIFSSIFGMGGNNQGKGGGGGGMKSGNLMDDIFGRPGMHPSQASAARQQQQNQGPQIPPGSVLQSKTTSRNADGTFQRDEVWRLPDGRVMKISHCYDKSGSPPEEGSSERFQQKSGGFGSFAEHVGANFQKQQQQKQQQQQQQPQYDSSGQKVNFPHNPFSQAGGGAEGRPFGSGFPSNPFGSPGSSFGSSSQSGSGGGFNPFEQAYARGPQPGQQSQQYQNPFASAGGSSSFSQSAFNPFSSFMNSGSGSSQGRGGTGGAFAGGSSTQQNPFAQYFGQRSNSPMGGMWFFSPGLRLVAVSLLIGFVLASLFSFSIHHPLFFIFLVTMLWVSRARRFF